ncbi:hypothetical protein GW764_01615 [Candidatus Parcubacteria bacterium]|nr:hypothetical protein [Candidatus Parcubacteria bacterium]
MDKEIQKFILESLKKRNYLDLEKTIVEDVSKTVWKEKKPIPADKIVKHNAKMLNDKGLIHFVDNQVGRYYQMTLQGKRTFDPWHKKAWYWILYDKNNLYTILSVLISLTAIIVSVIALNK